MSPLSLASMSFHWKSNSSFSEASLSTPPTLSTQKQIKKARMETASHSYSLHPLHKNKPCASSLLPSGTTQLNIPYAEHFVASGTLSLVTLFALCPICFIIYNTWSGRKQCAPVYLQVVWACEGSISYSYMMKSGFCLCILHYPSMGTGLTRESI